MRWLIGGLWRIRGGSFYLQAPASGGYGWGQYQCADRWPPREAVAIKARLKKLGIGGRKVKVVP